MKRSNPQQKIGKGLMPMKVGQAQLAASLHVTLNKLLRQFEK